MAAQEDLSLPPHFLPNREVHVVVSILSGRHKAKEYYEESVKPLLDRYQIVYFTHETKSAQTIIELSEKLFIPNARRGVKQTIVLLSGDGGMVDIVNTFTTVLNRTNDDLRAPTIFLKPVVVLIPMGTANALAWSSGVAHDALKTMMQGQPRSLPSFKVVFSPGTQLVVNEGRDREALVAGAEDACVTYGAVVCSWGLHASLVAMSDTSEYRKHGLARFKMAAEELLKQAHVYKGMVRWRKQDSEWIELPKSENSYILATMVSNLEEHFQISPVTKPLDGTLKLIAIGAQPADEIMRIMGLAYQAGKHVADPMVTYEDIEGMRIEFDEEDAHWRQVCVDGKIMVVPEDGWVEVSRIPGTGIDARRVVELVC
jgi:diacylglycerol kinase family enzyme